MTTQNEYDKKLIKWVKDHYWDSLEKEKELILRHLRTFTGDTEKPTPGNMREYERRGIIR